MSPSNLLLYFAALCSLSAQETPTFGTTVYVPGGLTGAIYFIEPTTNLPNLSKLTPIGNIYTSTLNVPLTEFREGFPGVTDRFEWFAIDYTGRFYIANPGTYRFLLFCDDGAKLFIDGKLIIDADGVGRRESGGSVKLSSGIHQIRVLYFQGPRYHLALILRVSRPGDPSFRVFDTDDFAPPLTSDPATPEIDARKPPLTDRQEAVQRAATKAAAYNASLPDFICTEILDRSENRSKHGWLPRDTLTVQLNYSGRKENHKLIAQNGKSKTTNFAALGGALSEGEFGSILADIFRPATAKFEWSHQQAIRGHNVYVFTYKVAQEKSGYAVQYSGGPARVSNGVTANIYRGDLQTGGDYNSKVHGFSVPTPAVFLDGGQHTVIIKYGGSTSFLQNTSQTLGGSTGSVVLTALDLGNTWVWSPVYYSSTTAFSSGIVANAVNRWNQIQNSFSINFGNNPGFYPNLHPDIYISDNNNLGAFTYAQTDGFPPVADALNHPNGCNVCYTNEVRVRVTLQLNHDAILTLATQNGVSSDLAAQFTLSHELGHALNLKEPPVAPLPSCALIKTVMVSNPPVMMLCLKTPSSPFYNTGYATTQDGAAVQGVYGQNAKNTGCGSYLYNPNVSCGH